MLIYIYIYFFFIVSQCTIILRTDLNPFHFGAHLLLSDRV